MMKKSLLSILLLTAVFAAFVLVSGFLAPGEGPSLFAEPAHAEPVQTTPVETAKAQANPTKSAAKPSESRLKLPAPFIMESGERLLPEFVFHEALPEGGLKEWGFVDLRGQPIVAVSWATWCGVCAKDLPELDALQATLAKDGVLVAALSIDDLSPQRVAADLKKRGLKRLRTFHDDEKMFFLTTSGVGVPSAIIADAEGRIVARAQGAVDWEDPAVVGFLRGLAKPL